MSYLRFAVLSVILTGCLLASAAAQQPGMVPAPMQQSAAVSAPALSGDENFIHKQFGEEFSLTPVSTPYVRDVDGDGVDDLVIVARSKKPMLDAAEHSYKVVDPYYDFYGSVE